MGGLEPGRALDLACGEGRNAVWLAERGWRVTGVDFSDVAIAKARTWRRVAAWTWNGWSPTSSSTSPGGAPSTSSPCCTCSCRATSSCGRCERPLEAVAPGGTLFVLGHDTTNLEHGHGGPKDSTVLFTPEDVVAELGDLVVERAEKVRRTVALDDGEATAIDALVRAHRRR